MRPKQSSKQVDNHTKLDVDLQAKIGESLRRCFVDVLRLHALRRQTDQSVANALHFRVHRRLPRQNHADQLEGNGLKYDFKSYLSPKRFTFAFTVQHHWGLRFMFCTPGPASHRGCKVLIFSLTIERISTIGIIAERILRSASSQPLLRVHIDGLIHFEDSFLTCF